MQRISAVLAVLALAAGCDSGSDEPDRAGTGARTEPHRADSRRVEVPQAPRDPPRATIVLSAARELARASQPGARHPEVVALGEPVLRGTSTGYDANDGVARVRVSFREAVRCAGGNVHRRTRYFPPPQIERIRSRPGARLPVRETRSVRITLGAQRCGAEGLPVTVHGELWGEAINGSGLEAVTSHIRFRYEGR